MKTLHTYLKAGLCLFLAALLLTGCALTNRSGDLIPVAQAIEIEIVSSYYDTLSDSAKKECTVHDLSVRYRGIFGDTYVVFVDGPFQYLQAITEEYVASFRFVYPDSQTMLAYHQGSFYSLEEAFALGLLTQENVRKLRSDYVSLGADRNEKGDAPTERKECTHIPKEPTEPTESSEPAHSSEPTESSTPAETTEPVDVMELLPDIPAVTEPCNKPENMALENLVYTLYDHSLSWVSKKGEAQSVTVQLPAIVPFCEGAIEINKEIATAAGYRLDSIRRDYNNQTYAYYTEISYTATLSGNILSIQMSTQDYKGNTYWNFWHLDIEAEKKLNTVDLSQRYLQESYPVFLRHCNYNTIEYFKANPLMNTDQQETLLQQLNDNSILTIPGYTLHLDKNGDLLVSFQVPQYNVKLTLPFADFNTYGWNGSEEDCYAWLFRLRADGEGADSHGRLLLESFLQNPQRFVELLSLEEDSIVSGTAQLLNYSLYSSAEIERYKELCDGIYLTASDPKVAETASILYRSIQPL